jgi:hypothetical protein
MDFIKIDDPRLDESYSFLFAFKKGDLVKTRNEPSLHGKITDGVYVGEIPKVARDVKARGKTLYEITLSDNDVRAQIVDEADIIR